MSTLFTQLLNTAYTTVLGYVRLGYDIGQLLVPGIPYRHHTQTFNNNLTSCLFVFVTLQKLQSQLININCEQLRWLHLFVD